jgi:hypothetical protein
MRSMRWNDRVFAGAAIGFRVQGSGSGYGVEEIGLRVRVGG